MANKLNFDKKIMAVSMLCEGNSIRSIERMTGIHRDTIMRLGVRVGNGCETILDEKMQNLNCEIIEELPKDCISNELLSCEETDATEL